ncbi:hypothetical protein ACOCJ5_16680, partial [Knoellia sp. CPCC 206450]|uniref:hypothetical protein n=1 Tax=Knoellia tibetensis TaxID=3404798 RepID=UPI003B42F9EA
RHTTTAPVDHLDRVLHLDPSADATFPARALNTYQLPTLTQRTLAALMSSPPVAPHSLAELALARLLDLVSVPHSLDELSPDEDTSIQRRPEPPPQKAALAVECHFGPRNAAVDIPTIDPRPSRPETSPPPF